MKRDYEEQILEICNGYESSKLYGMIKEAAEYLVTNSSDPQTMIDDLMDSAKNSYKDDPMHMLGYLNLLRNMGGNPFI